MKTCGIFLVCVFLTGASGKSVLDIFGQGGLCINPVNCFVDPCAVSHCDDPVATCKSNYCGGCHAVWTNPDGTRSMTCF